ncbi:MAG: hypothetical protein ACE5HU_02810 [Acidobacteriota bacterium]
MRTIPSRGRLAAACAVCLLAGWIPAQAASGRGPIKLDEPFPELVLPSAMDGAPMAVSSFRGEKLILHIFASW